MRIELPLLSSLVLAGALFVPTTGRCQQTKASSASIARLCDPAQSFEACLNDHILLGATKVGVEEQATAATNPGSKTSLLDFLSPLAGAFGFNGLSDTNGDFTFDRTMRLGDGARLKLGGTVFSDAGLFEALNQKLDEAKAGDEIEMLEGDIQDFDKVDFEALLSREGTAAGKYYGRSPDTYSGFIKGWQDQAVRDTGSTPFNTWRSGSAATDAIDRYRAVRAQRNDLPTFFQAPIEQVLAVLGDPELERQLAESLATLAKDYTAFAETVDLGKALGHLDELIANQPQAYLKGTYHERRHLTGPTEWTAEAHYEIGLSGNFNDFLTWARKQRGNCAWGEEDIIPPVDCLAKYMDSHPQVAAGETLEADKAEHGPRLELELKYTRTDPLHLALENGFQFDLDRSEVWTGSLTYGRYLSAIRLPHLPGLLAQPGVEAAQIARLDVMVGYDDATGDPMRQSRWLAHATLSQKTSEKSAVSLSLVWAENPEYLGEVDEALSTNLGLKWQLDSPQ
jgi:hypothetical protein